MYFLLIFYFSLFRDHLFFKKISFRININYCLIAIIPTILFFIIFQPEDIISRPATDVSFFPHWSILGYYFGFFYLEHYFLDLKIMDKILSRKFQESKKLFYWIPIASFVICLIISENKIYLLGELFNFIYTCSSILVIILIFYKFINKFNSKIRYLSDASYYIYIVHLPIIIFFQGLASSLEINHFIKFILIVVLTTIFSLITYHYFVRKTFIGVLLNGKRAKE